VHITSMDAEAAAAAPAEAPASAGEPSDVEGTWLARSRARKAQLAAVRNKEKAELDVTQNKNAKDRLAYLMRQTDIFAHFIRPANDEGPSTSAAAQGQGSSRRTKGRMTERQEDELLLQSTQDAEAPGASGSGTRLVAQPACISNGTMRAYQLEGLNWMIKLYEHGINGILADEMGLGKTLQTISLLGYLKEKRDVQGPHLVIAPKSTLTNWYKEFTRWCPSLRAFQFQGNKEARGRLKEQYLEQPSSFDVCLTTFDMVIAEKSALNKLVWRYLVIDEAHRIKNEQSVLSQVVRLFSVHFRLLITGTPLQNNLHELWAMLNFLLPDVFESSQQFDEWFNPDDQARPDDVLHQLHKILRPFLLRRLKADVEKDLPPKREIKLLIGMTEMQRTWYSNILSKNMEVLYAMGATKTRMHNILMQLRKCANHPYLFEGAEQPPFTNDERLIVNSGKMILLDKLLQRMHAQGHRVLIFSQMTRMLDILEDYCGLRNWEYCRIDGSTSGEGRDEGMEAFNAPGSTKFLFMLSTRAGGLGINLATADTVILYDSDWNPQLDLQAMDRAHRIGQTREVNVYRFMTEGSVEEKIIDRAQKKLYLDAAVIQQGRLAEQAKTLTKDEVLSMIRFGADAVFHSKGTDPSDEDIDALLARGEERTRQDNARFKSTSNSLANFSLGGEEKSLYEYDGHDWSTVDGKAKGQWSLSLPKRSTKQNYDENEYYRNMINKGQGEPRGPRIPKQLQTFDFQFYDGERLSQLRDKETRHWQCKQDRQLMRRARGDEKDDDHYETRDEKAAIEAGVPPLTEAEANEKEELLRQGFSNWTKKDFNAFVRGCELFGRHDLQSVTSEVEGKSEKEVAKYASVFFERYREIKDCEKIMKRIEQGEGKIQRRVEIANALSKKVSRCKHPWVTLRVDYGSGIAKGKQFNEENDRFLVCATNQLGYGRWEELRQAVRASWSLRFDWFVKTRTAQELARRVDVLARLIEKELAEEEAEEAARARKRPAAKKTPVPNKRQRHT